MVFDLFAGMGGLSAALESLVELSSSPTKIIMCETDPVARAVLSKGASKNKVISSIPDDKGRIGSVLALTVDDCSLFKAWMLEFPNVIHVLISGGSPC